ncbi:MAG: DNA topoisomerase VI subunit B [Candidatus Hodarchaeales archaeon]
MAKLLNVKSFESSEKLDFLRLTIRDNGSGIQCEFIPPLFGRVLTGSNYGARQSRGRFGLGAKMVLLNAMSSVDLPLVIKSKYINEDFTSYHELMINLAENEPIILAQREIPQNTTESIENSGTEVSVTFTGAWNLASRYIYEYFSQLAMITPYASFHIQYPDSETPITLERVVEEMPTYPRIAKVHPWGTDITQFKRELNITKSETMDAFLQDHFQGVGPKIAMDFLEFIKIDSQLNPTNLKASDIRRIIHEGFVMPEQDKKKRKEQKYFPFKRPSGDSLAPLGWELLEKGIAKELSPQFVRATSGDVSAHSGHPFIIEAALAYGGPNLSKEEGSRGANPKIYRFANRIPLLFGAGNDIITKCVQRMNWKNYKININKAPIAILVSVVSSKIPFPETSKEYIADVDELRNEIIRVLKKLARGLGQHLGRAERERRERQRQSRFESAAPKVIQNLSNILIEENSPFLLKSSEEITKLEKALASAVPRFVRRAFPPSPSLSSIGEWLPMDIHLKLVENDIQSIYQFLRTPIVELTGITGLSEGRILDIIRKTVTKQEDTYRSPNIRDFDFFTRDIEKDFTKFYDSPTILKAFNKRWIVNAFDFFSTPIKQLREVENFSEKLIYEAKLEIIDAILESESPEAFSLDFLSWLTPKIQKFLIKTKIIDVLTYLITFNEKISTNQIISIQLIENAKKEIREGVKDGFIDSEKVIGASTFDWMDYRVTPRLRGRKISKIKDFLNTPSEKLSELSELNENLVAQSKIKIKEKLKEFNQSSLLLEISGIKESMLKDLERLSIEGPIDFLLTPEKDLLIVRDFVEDLIKVKQNNLLFQINEEYDHVPIKKAYWLDLSLEERLNRLGITTIFDLISFSTKKLKEIKGMDPLVLQSIKMTYGTPLLLINKETRSKLNTLEILCLEELINVSNSSLIKPKSVFEKVEELLNYLNKPICYLDIPSKYYKILHHLGVSRIINFLMWPESELHRKSGLPYKIIEDTKSNLSLENIQKQITSKEKSIGLLAENLKGKSWDTILNSNISIQELYYELPYREETIKGVQLSKKEINVLIEIFNAPITRLSHIRPKWIDNLSVNGINSFIDLITWSPEKIASIIGREIEYVETLTQNIPKFKEGMPLIDLGVLTAGEIKILKSRGYSTVESIYFCANKQTFGVMGVKWKKIERYQRILETPIAMIQLQTSADSSHVRISHEGLEQLSVNGIDQIIKLIYWQIDELKSILNMPKTKIEELKQAVAIKEHGMPLEHVAGYNRKTISVLINYGIETVEDLYFGANEDMLDEDDDLDFSYVKKAVEALDIPITYLDGVIASKYITKLSTKRLDTILRFLISSEKELSEILETPPENVENLRRKINLLRLRESTETSTSIIEGLTRKQIRILADDNIFSIYDFLTTSDEQITNILDVESDTIHLMKQELNFSSIKTIKEEKMIPLTKISLYDKKTVKKFARYGIESLSDLYYIATPKSVEESEIEWQTILDARLVLDLPIEVSRIILPDEIKKCHKAKIESVLDLMIESHEKLTARTNIDIDRIKKVQESIRISELINLLKNLSITSIPFPTDYVDKISKNNIRTVYDLLSTPNEELYLKKVKDKRIRITKDLWIDLFELLSTPISLILGRENEDIKKLTLKKLGTIREVYSVDQTRLETILEKPSIELFENIRAINFAELKQLMKIPISFIPNLPLEWVAPLRTNSIKFTGQIIRMGQKDLSSLVSASFQKIRSVVSEITFERLLRKFETEKIPLESFSSVLSEKSINLLDEEEVTSIQALILRADDGVHIEEVSELMKILDGPINRLSDDFQIADLRKLSHNGISTLSTWFYAPNDGLAKLLGLSVEEITEIKKSFDILNLSQAVEAEISLVDVIEPGYIEIDQLNKRGIKSLEDLLFIEIESIDAPDQFKARLFNMKDSLNSSLAYYSLIPSSYVVPLAFNAITSIYQLILTEFSQLDDPMGIITEEIYSMARNSVNLVSILTHKKTESEFRVKLSSLRAFTPKQLGKIQELGIDNVIDLYFRLNIERCPKSLLSAVDGVKRVLEKPVAVLPQLRDNFPSKIPLLLNIGVTSIIEFLFWNKEELAEILEIKRYEISKYRKVDLTNLRRKKNLGTPIQNFIRIPESYYETLQEFGIDNIEDLYFYTKRYPDLIPDDIFPRKLLTGCVSDLETPVVKLADLPIPSASELVKKGVTRIIDFIYWPDEDLKSVHGLSVAKVKKIKSRIRLRRKTDVLGQLDSYMGS